MLEFHDFIKEYGGKPVIGIPSIFIPTGLHWIRGKNGSGKSSLFRCIAGISPFKGSIRLNDAFDPVKNPVEYRSRVNFSEAEPQFPSFLSGKELLQFVARAKNTDLVQLEKVISQLHLPVYFENPCGTYSSGMNKKISLAMAFLGKPELIILDEPFITLDSESCRNLGRMIEEARAEGAGILLSSHPDLSEGLLSISQTYEISEGIFQQHHG